MPLAFSKLPTTRRIGANPYAEAVVESAQGQRFVHALQGWLSEDECSPVRVCRATSEEAVRQALSSLCVAPVARAFNQNWLLAYTVWSTPRGTPTPSAPPNMARAQAFASQVVALQAEHGWLQWMGDAPRGWGRLKWEHVIASRGRDGWPMGILAGVAGRLGPQGEEVGLAGCPASTGRAGWVQVGPTTLPSPPDGRANFHGTASRTVPEGFECVLWWSARRPKQWSTSLLDRWFSWWEQGGAGWWITDEPDAETTQRFEARLRTANRPFIRHRINEGQTTIEAWQIGTRPVEETVYTLAQWAGPAPGPREKIHPEARDGRQPYQPASLLPATEGWAPTGLARAMEEGLAGLVAMAGSVDAHVARLLDRPVEGLGDVLSAEQVDAVALAYQRLLEGQAFLLADETGFGKGRVLAALALIGLSQSRTVVILTERKQLFNDLFRDLSAVAAKAPPVPLLFHGDAQLVNAKGEVVVKSPRGKAYQQLLTEHAWPASSPRLVFTTYAQLAAGKTKEKMAWLLERMGKGAWLLLDESHNAAGNSLVNEQVDRLIGKAGGVVHASATFVRGESNLSAYRRALPWGPSALPWIRSALSHDPGPLRQVLVEEIARAGFLLRREHAPVPPPVPVWMEPSSDELAAMSAFVQMWQRLFAACEQWEIAQGGAAQLAWLKIGAVMSRSVREFLLWLKAPALVARMKDLKSRGRKVVVAVDSTMEAALREALDASVPGESDELSESTPVTQGVVAEGHNPPPLWRQRWVRLLDTLVPEENGMLPKVKAARDLALESILQLPAWSLSPLDWVMEQSQQAGIVCGEISGRTTTLSVNDQSWQVRSRTPEDRTLLVRRFNDGEVDALLLTRAAASGISLHAGSLFQDQRPRTLIEWGVAADPLVRMQFWGRVRRRDQVVEPDFESIAINTPSERRLRARDERKRRQLSAHLGTSSDGEIDLLSPLGEELVQEWANENPGLARRLGVSRPLPDDPIGRADRILARSLVLPEADRALLIERLDAGLAASSDFYRAASEPASMSSRIVRSQWWWGDPSAPRTRHGGVWPWRLDWVERVWLPQPNTSSSAAVEFLKQASGQSGAEVLAQWRQVQQGKPTRGEYHAQGLKWASQALPALSRGAAIQMSNPVSGAPTRAMVLGVHAPQSMHPTCWSLSQLSAHVLLVGAPEPLRVPLSALFADHHFKPGNMRAQSAWFDEELTPTRAIVVEGNPLAAAAWGRRFGKGWSQVLHDESGQSAIVWRLPSEVSWDAITKLPRDLVAVEQVFAYWRDFPDEPLAAALPWGHRCLAQPLPGVVSLRFDQDTYTASLAQWLDASLGKLLSPARQVRENGKIFVVRAMEWKMARRWFEKAAMTGLTWRVPSHHSDWYETQSAEWFARRKP